MTTTTRRPTSVPTHPLPIRHTTSCNVAFELYEWGTMGNRLKTRNVAAWIFSLLAGFCISVPERLQAADETAQFSRSTFVYKTVDQLKIQADVYRHNDSVKRPVIVWLHGGALIMGSRSGVPKQLKDLAEQQRFVLVSLDYRLAPEAKLPEIIADLREGLEWVRKSGPTLFHADPSRLVVAGASAGGYLALMSGISKKPPTAIVSYWGFGDVDGDWTTKPSESYRKGKDRSRN
jgi:acetyl esterase/lipase